MQPPLPKPYSTHIGQKTRHSTKIIKNETRHFLAHCLPIYKILFFKKIQACWMIFCLSPTTEKLLYTFIQFLNSFFWNLDIPKGQKILNFSYILGGSHDKRNNSEIWDVSKKLLKTLKIKKFTHRCRILKATEDLSNWRDRTD